MSGYIFFIVLVLGILAVFLKADFVLILAYLILGVFFLGKWWGGRAIRIIAVNRKYTNHIFFGEKVSIELEIKNTSLFPVVWLQFQELFPLALITNARNLREVISLKPKEKVHYQYQLEGRKRGIYPVGPLTISSGDIFGLAEPDTRQVHPEALVVYPRIVPLSQVNLPSNSPMGTLKYAQPIFEDPTRVRGKRDYINGDSLRRIDWKATAVSGKLQVKLFEPSISLETALFLNLNSADYDRFSRLDATELGIVVSASLANWIITKKQFVGLYTNGVEALLENESSEGTPEKAKTHLSMPIPPRRGRAQLIRILETLARVQTADEHSFLQMVQNETGRLPWGTTLIILSSKLDDALFDCLFQARRSGLKPVLIPCGPVPEMEEKRNKAKYFGIPLYQVYNERDLDRWRHG